MQEQNEPFNFNELASHEQQANETPPLESFHARDGVALAFRRYTAESNVHLILIHGSSAHSAYLHTFAEYLGNKHIANVYTPDLRGHGPNPQRRGDIDHIGQLEEDIADLITHIKTQTDDSDNSVFIIGGHSSGGGMALRFSGSQYGNLASGLLLLAPFFGHNAPMVKKNSGGWASPKISRIIGLSILNGFGIKRFNGAKVLCFNLPAKYQNGEETLEYSFRLMTGMHPDDYKKSLANSHGPLLLLVGTQDEAFYFDKFESGVVPFKSDAQIAHIEGSSHLGITLHEAAMQTAAGWIKANFTHSTRL